MRTPTVTSACIDSYFQFLHATRFPERSPRSFRTFLANNLIQSDATRAGDSVFASSIGLVVLTPGPRGPTSRLILDVVRTRETSRTIFRVFSRTAKNYDANASARAKARTTKARITFHVSNSRLRSAHARPKVRWWRRAMRSLVALDDELSETRDHFPACVRFAVHEKNHHRTTRRANTAVAATILHVYDRV